MMVHHANTNGLELGGHLASYASLSTILDVAFNHFIKGKDGETKVGDRVYFQGHSSPGIYARAFLEKRLNINELIHFRREATQKGLSSYPHPWLMPEFWTTPTVSMGLGPLHAIMQARFFKMLKNRGILTGEIPYVWCFCGDGEMDEPESSAALSLASREKLDNLTFIVSCNLQKLDGPVRGNGKIIQELESRFLAMNWDVKKCIWGPLWSSLLSEDKNGELKEILYKMNDGEFQNLAAKDAEHARSYIQQAVSDDCFERHFSDYNLSQWDQLKQDWGGHDRALLYSAFESAKASKGPSVILAKTIKGLGLGTKYQARNIAHKAKSFSDDESLEELAKSLNIPWSKIKENEYYFYRSDEASEYALRRREVLKGSVPKRKYEVEKLFFGDKIWKKFLSKSDVKEFSTTKSFGKILKELLKSEHGERIVPIFPDEARTFGLEPLFGQFHLYRSEGQDYEPVDSGSMVEYSESENGQLINEGISEAQAMGTFIASGTSYESISIPTIPFYIFYSQFGVQRVGDQFWAAGDSRARGFLLGATAGRTTLNGEGLQHQDGHSLLWTSSIPNLKSYDPAFEFELVTIMEVGVREMYQEEQDIFYYINLYNENTIQIPYSEVKCERDEILKGLYRVTEDPDAKADILASGSLMQEALKAHRILKDSFNIETNIWSVTSYSELYRDAQNIEQWNSLSPYKKKKVSYLGEKLNNGIGPIVAVSDYVSQLPHLIGSFIERDYCVLGTNGYGRSDTREKLRSYFNVDDKSIVWTVLVKLYDQGAIGKELLDRAEVLRPQFRDDQK